MYKELREPVMPVPEPCTKARRSWSSVEINLGCLVDCDSMNYYLDEAIISRIEADLIMDDGLKECRRAKPSKSKRWKRRNRRKIL